MEVRFEADVGLDVWGTLVAMGTITQPITFTSNLTMTAPGDWVGLSFVGDVSQGRLAWCDVSYGGAPMPEPSAALEAGFSSDVEIAHCRIHHNASHGVSIFESQARLTDAQVEDNQGHGIVVEGISARPILEDVSIANNQGAAVWQDAQVALPIYRNLTATANLTDAVVIAGGEVSTATLWDLAPAGIPVQVYGDIVVVGTGSLSIAPRTALHFITDTQIVVMGGDLYALGTPTAPITFTALSSQPGGWGGISVYGRAIFRYCDIGYGGGAAHEYWPLLDIFSDEVVAQYCRIHHSAGDGIRAREAAVIVFSQIYSNSQTYSDTFGLRAGEEEPVTAVYDWWGHPSGPFHPLLNPDGQGEPITGNVTFSPWLTSTVVTPPAEELLIYISGPGRPADGEPTDYVVFYHNLSTSAITVPLVVALPHSTEYVESSEGVYWPERHELVVRPEGGIAPGQEGAIWVRIRLEWGLPQFFTDHIKAFSLSEHPMFPDVLADYLNYTPTVVAAADALSPAEFDALRQSSPDFDALYTYALSDGMRLGQAEWLTLSTGVTFTQATLMDLERGATMYIRVPVSGTVLASRFEPPATYIMLDATGGVTRNLDTGTWTYWGSWAEEGQAASIKGMGFSKCLRNCLVPRFSLSLLTKRLRSLSSIMDSLDCVSCGTGDQSACLKCAAALKGVPWVGETLDFIDCFEGCRTNPSQYSCTRDKVVCYSQYGEFQDFWHYNRMYWIRPATYEYWECDWWGNLVWKKTEACITSTCARCLPDYGCWDPCGDISNRDKREDCCDQNHRRLKVIVAVDPNAKYGPAGDLLPGQLITYTIAYENEGSGTAYGVFILDTLDERLDEKTLQIGGGGRYITPTRTLVWPIGEVAPQGEPGSAGTVTFTVRLQPDLPGGTRIMNQAVVYFPSVPEETPTNVVINFVAPVSAEPQTVRTGAMQPISITLRGRDVGNAPLTYTVVSEPHYGRLSGAPPNLTYSPMENWVGVDWFTFQVSNGITTSRPAEVTIRVDPSPADDIPPQVRWTEPASGTVGVFTGVILTDTLGPAYAPVVYVQFSEVMSATTITSQTVQLRDSRGRPLSATVTYDGLLHRVRLTPREPLRTPGVYTGWVSAAVTDVSGNPLGANHTWRFWTEVYRLYLPLVWR